MILFAIVMPATTSAQERISFPEAVKSVEVPNGWVVAKKPKFAPMRSTCSPAYETAIQAKSPDRKMELFVF
jgi:hypothetical protein